MRRLVGVLLLIAVLLAGCGPRQIGTSGPPAPATATAAAPAASPARQATMVPLPASTATASPSSVPGAGETALAPAPTSAPATMPSPPPATAATEPPANWGEWSVYLSALRPDQRPAGGPGATLAGMTQYHLTVRLSADLKLLQGTARIRYTNRSAGPLPALYLHLYPNLWHDGMTVSGVQAGGQPVTVQLQEQDSLLEVVLPTPLAAGAAVDLALDFADPIPEDGNGGNFGDFSYRDGVLALAQFYPTMVVYEETGWHLEPPSEQGDVLFHQASLYDVTLTAPAGLTVAATGETLGRHDNGDGSATWRLVGGPMRDFNIVASARFEHAASRAGAITVNSYFLPEDADGGRQALTWAKAALNTYQTDFGPYPYNELDVVETATTAGGIEYPGLIVVASSLYTDPNRRTFFENATVHEVAHQWWYNVVGDDQVNTPWLDEALAQYSSYLYFQAAYGDPAAQQFVSSLRDRWARVKNEDKPIGLPVAAYSGEEYGAIVYGRGPLFLLAVQDKIGEKTMLKFLQRYYADYAWQIATPPGFQTLMQQVAGQDLSALFDAWVYPPR